MQKQSYTIPDFTHRQLIDYFNDIQIPVTQNDLIRPTPQAIQSLYETILTVFTNTKIIDLIPESENSESIYLCLLLRKLNDFLTNIGSQIILKDIIIPDQKRVVSILSTIMNFSMYRDTKRELYEEVIRSCREKEDLRDGIENKINEAVKKLEEAEIRNKKEKIEVSNLEEEINAIDENLKNDYKIYLSLASNVEKLKNEKNELSDRESSNQLLLVNCKQDLVCLKTQIVGDPSKLFELLSEMKEMVVKEKKQIENFEIKKNMIIKNCIFLEKLKDEIMNKIKRCVVLNNNIIKEEELKKKILLSQSTTDSYVNTSECLKKKISLLERQILQVESKLNKLKENTEISSQDVINKMENLKISYEKINKDKTSLNEKIQANIKWAKEIESEMIVKYNEYIEFVNQKKDYLKELNESIRLYFSEMKNILNQFGKQSLISINK